MPTAEFDLPATHQDVVVAPPIEFPLDGVPEDAVLSEVSARLEANRYERDRNFAITYSGTPHPISRRVEALAEGTFFVEWADESETGTLSMEREAVRMVASLLGDPEAVGFITSGGTESNLAALRLMRNNGHRSEPEVVAP